MLAAGPLGQGYTYHGNARALVWDDAWGGRTFIGDPSGPIIDALDYESILGSSGCENTAGTVSVIPAVEITLGDIGISFQRR
ncbi:MAG: hypothetical protein OEP95_11385 [Myxococcales bacterium]|nr:hypothetical protein [Myxococcales bacterium]